MSLAQGQVVGGRFAIREERSADAFGRMFTARDQRSERDVSIRLVNPKLFPSPEAVETLRRECKRASKVRHGGVLATYGLGKAGEHIFIASEASEGLTLWDTYARQQNRPAFSMRAINHIVAHLSQAVAALPDDVPHGLIAPATVVLSESGRVRLAELGLTSALIRTGGLAHAPDELIAFAAPEVRGGAAPSRATDVYGLGAISHFLLTGTAPGPTSPAPSTLHPEATKALDEVITACLAPTEQARPSHLDSVRDAFERSMTGPRRDPSIEIEIALSEPPPSMPPAGNSIPVEVRKSYVPATGGSNGAASTFAAAIARDDELAEYLAQVTKNDAHRWMVSKGGIDHGPFSGQDLVQKIVAAEVLAEHELFNTETGLRCTVGEVDQFVPFLEQQKLRLAEMAEAAALERSEVVEKRSNVTKIALLSGVGLAVIVGVGFFIMHLTEDDQQSRSAELADLFESGKDLDITGTAGVLPTPSPRKGGRKRRGGGGGFGSYEDAMNQAVDLGDATGGGDMSQLTGAQVSSIMNRNLNSMFSCVGQELRSSGQLGKVTIDLAIAGNGSVLGASVRPGSTGFQNCIQGKVKRIKFPSFGAPRMGARYSFDPNQ